MSKNLIFIFLIMLIFSFSIAQENENMLIVNGEKLYFSIAGHINWKYYNYDINDYSKILKSYYIKRTQEIGHKDNRFGPTEIDLPDSLSIGFFDIKKGFYSVKIDSLKLNPIVINGFKTTTSIEGSGRSRVIVTIPNIINENWSELFIFSKSYDALNQISPNNSRMVQNNKTNTKIKKSITNYFFENPEVLKKQVTYLYPIADSLNEFQLKNEISSRFDLMSFKLNNNCYIVKGVSTEYKYHKFFAIVFPNGNKVLMKTHTKFYQSFKINDEYFFFCHYYKPYTGGNVYYVYQLKGDELEIVFGDVSYSM